MPVFTIETPAGKRLTIQADDEQTALQGAQEWHAQNAQQTDTSLSGAVRQGASDIASGVGSTLKNFTGATDAADVAKGIGAGLKQDGYQSASAEFAKTLDPSLIPRGLVEQLPGLATDVLSATALGKLTKFAKLGAGLGRVAGGVGSFGARTLGPEAEARAAYRTGDVNATPTDEDKTYAVGSTGVQALINQAGLSRFLSPRAVTGVGAKGVAQSALGVGEKALAEGSAGAAQSAVSQAGQTINTPKGLNIDFNQALAEGVLGAAGGGTFATARGAKDAMAAVRMRDLGGFEDQATRVANRMTDKVGGDSADLGAKSSFTAIEGVRSDLNNEIAQAKRGQALPIEASNAIKRAVAGKELNETDIAAVDATAPDLADLVKQAHALTVLKRIGVYDDKSKRFAGGPTERVRKFVMHHPTFSMKYVLPPTVASGGTAAALSGDALMGALPGIGTAAMIGAAGYGGAKFAENLLGLSNPARTFAEKFADGTTPVRLPPPQTIRSPTPSVPRVARHQPAQPWGAPAPAAPATQANLPALLQQVRAEQKAKSQAAPSDPFEAYPPAEWAYETPEAAGRMVYDIEKAAGRNIYNPEGYRNGIAKRVDAIDTAIGAFAQTVDKSDLPQIENIMERFKGVRSLENARDFRNVMKAAMPQYADQIDQFFSDDWIRSVWSKGRT